MKARTLLVLIALLPLVPLLGTGGVAVLRTYGRLAHRNHRRMIQLRFHGDGVEAFADVGSAADQLHVELSLHH